MAKNIALCLRNKPNKNMYSWADALFREGKLKGPVLHTLKAIIACLGLEQPTIEQINKARTRSASRKFAQSSPVDNRTIRRHIQQLEGFGCLQVSRTRDARRNSRNSYRIMAVEDVVSCRSEDIMSSSITLATSYINNNTKNDLLKRKRRHQLNVVFNKQQLAILAVFEKWGTWKPTRSRWMNNYTMEELQNGINYVMSKDIPDENRGGYMATVIKGLDERKRQKSNLNTVHPGLMKTDMVLHDHDEMRRNRSTKETARKWLDKIKGRK